MQIFLVLLLVLPVLAIPSPDLYEKLGSITAGLQCDTNCSLQCFFLQKYKAGICALDENSKDACYCELKYPESVVGPEKLGPCKTGADGDSSCGMQCLFYPRYNGGKCVVEKSVSWCYCNRK